MKIRCGGSAAAWTSRRTTASPRTRGISTPPAGTRLENGRLLTNGGRVLCVTALGDSIRMARSRAYEVVDRVRFAGMQYRRDIGHRALDKKRPA